ncbi:uncharacterized protein F4812DRAFT_280498 [Daldinia caldariorum]|uniref:uncharacterized protein n=1 Tax=Daldinia caldariorum TaxID=326644 RepID=UPI002007E041|nr:uncharacterized protein F4812DRAFT_280498 [Daldinia caldariorum]KAI1470835.1 hypothetical protein F4812DRAFT_280498 [Daldinia caldariorum]
MQFDQMPISVIRTAIFHVMMRRLPSFLISSYYLFLSVPVCSVLSSRRANSKYENSLFFFFFFFLLASSLAESSIARYRTFLMPMPMLMLMGG